MKTSKFAAAAIVAVAATGVTAAAADATPAPAAYSAPAVSYTSAWTPDHATLTATVNSGRFAVTPRGLDVLGSNGAVVAQIPTRYQTVTLLPTLNPSGTVVTLRSDRPVAQHLQDIDLNSTVAGVAIGCVVGALIGAIFLILPAIPGCVVGAVVGGIIGANQ